MKRTHETETTYVLTFRSGDVRECRKVGNRYVHVLHTTYQIAADDPRIITVTPYLTPQSRHGNIKPGKLG